MSSKLERVRAHVRAALAKEGGVEFVVVLVERRKALIEGKLEDVVEIDVMSGAHCSACAAYFLAHAKEAADKARSSVECSEDAPKTEREVVN